MQSKPLFCVDDGRNLSETCLLDRWLSVLRLQECDNRLIKGTGESCHAMLNGKKKQANIYASMKVKMGMAGAEEFVVVLKVM